MSLSRRERRALRRDVRREMISFRRENPDMSNKEFKKAVTEHLEDVYEAEASDGEPGIDPEVWERILEIITQLLPIILKIFL